MLALCARRLVRSGLLPGLMRPAGAASVIPTSPPLRAAEVGITRLWYRSRAACSKMARARVTPGRLTPLARGHPAPHRGRRSRWHAAAGHDAV